MISASMVKELREISGAGMLDCKKALEATNGNMEEAITWLREKGISKAAKKQTRIAAEGLAHIEIKGNKAVIIEVNSETDFVAKNQEFVNLVKTIASTIIDNNVSTVEEALKLKAGENTLEELIIDKTSKIGEKISFRRFEIVEKEDTEVFGTYSHMGGKIAVLTRLTNNEEVAKDIAMQAAAMRPLYLTREDIPSEVLEKERTILKEQAENEGLDSSKIDMIVNGRINKYYKEVCLVDQLWVKDGDKTISKLLDEKSKEVGSPISVASFVRFERGEGIEKVEENFAEEVAKQMGK